MLITDDFGMSRDQLQTGLRDLGVDTRRAAYQIHTMPPYLDHQWYPVAERLSRQGLHLPSGVPLSDEDQGYVIESIQALAGRTMGRPAEVRAR
jgi:perosamine synthetase